MDLINVIKWRKSLYVISAYKQKGWPQMQFKSDIDEDSAAEAKEEVVGMERWGIGTRREEAAEGRRQRAQSWSRFLRQRSSWCQAQTTEAAEHRNEQAHTTKAKENANAKSQEGETRASELWRHVQKAAPPAGRANSGSRSFRFRLRCSYYAQLQPGRWWRRLRADRAPHWAWGWMEAAHAAQ